MLALQYLNDSSFEWVSRFLASLEATAFGFWVDVLLFFNSWEADELELVFAAFALRVRDATAFSLDSASDLRLGGITIQLSVFSRYDFHYLWNLIVVLRAEDVVLNIKGNARRHITPEDASKARLQATSCDIVILLDRTNSVYREYYLIFYGL